MKDNMDGHPHERAGYVCVSIFQWLLSNSLSLIMNKRTNLGVKNQQKIKSKQLLAADFCFHYETPYFHDFWNENTK